MAPSASDMHHIEQLPHAVSSVDAMNLATAAVREARYPDAYHVIAEYMKGHPLEEELFLTAVEVINLASRFDRDRNHPPLNMLYECEELAAILARRIPEMFHVHGPTDGQTRVLYRCVRAMYTGWCHHARALLQYKYLVNSREYMRRNWVDPRDFGCLVDIMRMAMRSRLTLDLLRFVYTELKPCVRVGMEVIAHDDKKAKFEGDLLRILASPTKDVVPDLTFEIYKEITQAYVREGDTAGALTFCKQALLMRNNDSDMLKLKAELSDIGAQRMKRPR